MIGGVGFGFPAMGALYPNNGMQGTYGTNGLWGVAAWSPLPTPGCPFDVAMQQMLRILQNMASNASPQAAGTGKRNLSSLLDGYLKGVQGASKVGAPQKGEATRIPGGKSIYSKGMFHKGVKGCPTYAFENSPQGIKYAAKHGYSSIDLDMQITKDGVLVNTHWSQPMAKDGFYDPLGKLDPKTKVSEMTFAEVSRLRNRDGQSRIHTMESQIALLKKYGIAGDLEAKNDKRFATDKVMGQISSMVRKSGIKANLKSIDRGPGSRKILKKAQEYGFWVRTAKGNGKSARNIGYAK